MDAGTVRACCLAKPGAYGDSPSPARHWVTPKCGPMRADFHRQLCPGDVVRGYHRPPVRQPHNNTVCCDRMEDGVLIEMMDHAYERVLSRLPKAVRRELAGEG